MYALWLQPKPQATTTIEAQLPEPVLEQARALAERERIPLAQLITLAVTQSVGIWSHESYVAHVPKTLARGIRGALGEVPDSPPLPGDEWPQ
jgi:hypothetical protein